MPEPSPYETGEFNPADILARLQASRLEIQRTAEGSRLGMAHVEAPTVERRRRAAAPPEGQDRRRFSPLPLPTLFPEQGPILLLLVGGFADEAAMQQPAPFWGDDVQGGALLWQAVERAGLVARPDRGKALGQGGFWEERPPRTQGLAATHAGFQPKGQSAPFDLVAHRWNQHRLQTLVQGCWDRSMGRLKVVAVGEAARFVMGAVLYDLRHVPLLALPEPTPDTLEAVKVGRNEAAEHWVQWAAALLEIGRG